jgi:hypothetical protein
MGPLFEQTVHVRLNAPGSRYHGATGTVDATELERVRGKDEALTLNLDDGDHTVAYGDELEVVGSTPLGGTSDNEVSPTSEGQP